MAEWRQERLQKMTNWKSGFDKKVTQCKALLNIQHIKDFIKDIKDKKEEEITSPTLPARGEGSPAAPSINPQQW